MKVKVQVNEPFNLILPPGGKDPEVQRFDKGIHVVSVKTAEHAWTKHHAEVVSEPFEDEADLDAEFKPAYEASKKNGRK